MAGPSQDPRRPTFGETMQLERISTAAWALIGERDAPGQPATYRLVERGTGSEIHTLTAKMVEGLERAGWIERTGGDARRNVEELLGRPVVSSENARSLTAPPEQPQLPERQATLFDPDGDPSEDPPPGASEG